MSEPALLEVHKDDVDAAAEEHERRVTVELNSRYEALRDQAQALFAAVKGRRGVYRDEDWQRIFREAKSNYGTGRFLVEKLGAERYLEPELMATLTQLRRDLLDDIESPTAADTMMADSAVLAYHNMLRVQGWIGNICLTVERELFGQVPLNELQGEKAAETLKDQITRLEVHLVPLLDRCHRMMARSFAYLDSSRRKSAPSVVVAQAGQVNVDCAVTNAIGR
jgi:hypothetical protein